MSSFAGTVRGQTPLMIVDDADLTLEQDEKIDMQELNTSRVEDEEKDFAKRVRVAPSQAKLRKTEVCKNWKRGFCNFGSKCKFAHGIQEIQTRIRPSNYRTKVCEELARSSHKCSYVLGEEKRCNFAHPGDGLRVAMPTEYTDEQYARIQAAHRADSYPRGIYL